MLYKIRNNSAQSQGQKYKKLAKNEHLKRSNALTRNALNERNFLWYNKVSKAIPQLQKGEFMCSAGWQTGALPKV